MATDAAFDFDIRSAPETWKEAAVDAPEGDANPLRRRRVVGDLPIRYEIDTVTASLSAMIVSIVAGTAWYMVEVENALNSPWVSVVLGALIAVAVRLGAGPHLPEIRATLAVIFYIVTVLAVAYMVERTQFIAIYGNEAAIAGGERGLVRDRLTEPQTVAAWTLGLLTATQVSYLLRKR